MKPIRSMKLLAFVFLFFTACNSKPTPELVATVASASSSPHHVGGPLRLAPDAGVQPSIAFVLSAPIQPPFGDAQITGVEIRSIDMDLTSNVGPTGAVVVHVGSIGGDVQKTRNVILNLTPTQQTNFLAAIKAGTAQSLGVTFQ